MKNLLTFACLLLSVVATFAQSLPLRSLEVPSGVVDGQVMTYFGAAKTWFPATPNSTNVTANTLVLSPTSQDTNYTLALVPGPQGNVVTIASANTNIFLTFTGTNQADFHRTLLLSGATNSIVTQIFFNLPAINTNVNFVRRITNGTFKVLAFYNPDTTGTNVMVTDYGTYQH